MNSRESAVAPGLAHAGYLILRSVEDVLPHEEFRRRVRYRGVDRYPLFIAPQPEIRRALGEPLIEDPRLYSAIDELFDAGYGNTAFIPEFGDARRLWRAFQELGFAFELLYCQLAWRCGEEDRLKDYPALQRAPPAVSQTYGFDVSWPGCNHSAIAQPGLVSAESPWWQKLNQYGLLDDYESATTLREEYLRVYPYPPFDIYLVHAMEKP